MTDNQDENKLHLSTNIDYKHSPEPTIVDQTKDNYGDNYQEHLLEQYKLYVEMTDKVSETRDKTNSFYISLTSGLLAFISLVADKKVASEFQNYVFLAVGILGLSLCLLWYFNIQSYRHLNSGKFKVICEMEQHLPFACYNKEWEILKRNKSHRGYLTQTSIQQYIPLAFATPYFGLLIYSIYSLLK